MTARNDGLTAICGTVRQMAEPITRLSILRDGNRLVLEGDLDAHTCPDLASALDPLPGSGDIRVDVAEVGFIDSSGLRVFIGAHQAAVSANRKLLIARPSKSVLRIIELSGLAEHLNIDESS